MITILDTDAALQALLPEWDALWRRAAAPPFQSTAWLLPWWSAFGTGQPGSQALRANGRLAGLLPLYLLDEGAERKLLPIGVGITDYCDALIDPSALPSSATSLLQASLARARLEGVTSCTLPDLPPGSALLAAATPADWHEVAQPGTPCPVPHRGRSHPERATPQPAPSRATVRSAAAAGAPGVGSVEDAPDHWRRLMDLHRARWDGFGGGPGASWPIRPSWHSTTPRSRASPVRACSGCRSCGSAAGSPGSTTRSPHRAAAVFT